LPNNGPSHHRRIASSAAVLRNFKFCRTFCSLVVIQ
jgi:hypothetical protein